MSHLTFIHKTTMGYALHQVHLKTYGTGNTICQQGSVKYSTAMTIVLRGIHTAIHTAPQVTERCGRKDTLVKFKRQSGLQVSCSTGNNISCKNL